MPKTADSSNEEEVKAPRKRAPRRAVATKTPRVPRVPRAPRVSKSVRVEDEVVVEPNRKAPTRLPEAPVKKRRLSLGTVVNIFILLLVIGATVWIGFSDSGQIDVNAKISERNIDFANGAGNGDGSVHVPVQTAPTVPNGGLVGQGVLNAGGPTTPPAEVATTTGEVATTTEDGTTETASSTETTSTNTDESNATDSSVSEQSVGENSTPS